jgi:outer membrane protein assembly factor BamB
MTPVACQGFLYGQFGIQQFDFTPATQLKCIDMHTGEVKWSTNDFGHGGTLLVDNQLLIITEKGELVLAAPDPNAYTELGRFLAIPDYFGDTNKCWNSPAVADGRVYVRSTAFGACFDLSLPQLKLDVPVPVPANKFQLTVRTATGAAIDSNRLAGMQILSSTNPLLTPSLWNKLTNLLTLTNGTVRVTNVEATTSSKGFFMVSEPN